MHFQDWVSQERNKEKIQEVQLRWGGAKHKILRDLRTIHRTACYEEFGGREWMWILLAYGKIDAKMIRCMSQAMSDRKEEIRAAAAAGQCKWVEVSAAPRDRDPNRQVHGIMHHNSTAKQLREAARRLERQLQKEEDQWRETGRSRMSWRQWESNHQELARMWDQAEWQSQRAGVEYTDRHGQRRNVPEQDNAILGRALRKYEGTETATAAAGTSASSRGRVRLTPR